MRGLASSLAVGLSLAACAPTAPARLGIVSPAASAPGGSAGPYAAEERRSAGIRGMHAEPALAGADGRGVDVAVIDTGIDPNHRELRGNLHPASRDVVGSELLGPNGHGTHIAGIIAAARDGRSISGIAPGARLLALRADARDAGCRQGGCYFRDGDLARAVDAARLAGADVINLSLGKPTPVSAELTAAIRRAALSGALVVAAAGNGDSTMVSWPARLATGKGFAGRMLAVGAVDRQDRLWAFSNRPGETALAGHFLVAPGVDILSTVPGGFARASGTSMAAAHVSGAAALLKSLFPELSMARISRLLLETGRDLGAEGIDPVFGAGAVDLAAAIAPRGRLRSAGGIDFASSALAAGQAFGDGAGRALARDVGAHDGWGRAYSLHLGEAVAAPLAADPLAAWLRQPPAQWRGGELSGAALSVSGENGEAEAWRLSGMAGLAELALARGIGDPFAAGGPFLQADPVLGLVGDATAASLALPLGDPGRVRLLTLTDGDRRLDRLRLDGRWADLGATLTFDRLDEAAGPLGSEGRGALAMGGATTHLLGVGLRWQATSRLELAAAATAGLTRVAGSEAIDGWSPLVSTAWSLDAVAADMLVAGDSLGLRLGQPLRVERAKARLRLDGDDAVDLVPSGRELDLELAWRAGWSADTDLALSLLLAYDAGHASGQGLDGGFGLRLRRQF